jgi:outer membrane lipoprotein carrier protein
MQSILFTVVLMMATLAQNVHANDVLSEFLNKLNTFSGQFQQQRFDEQNELLETSTGQFFIQRPRQFRWEYQKPYQQLLVADGRYVWIYETDLAQVTIKTLDETLHNSPVAFLLEQSADLDKYFSLKVLNDTPAQQQVQLTPKDKNAQFEEIVFSFSQQQLNRLQLSDNLGQRTVIHFSALQTNLSLDKALFQFEPPEGVDVVDGRD